MLRYFTTLILAFAFSLLANAEKKPFLSLDQTEYNLGKVSLSVKNMTVRILIKNYGDAPLNIKDVLTDCSCTTVEIDKSSPILPDQNREMLVHFDIPTSVSGNFDKEIWIHSDSEQNEVSIKFHLLLTNSIE